MSWSLLCMSVAADFQPRALRVLPFVSVREMQVGPERQGGQGGPPCPPDRPGKEAEQGVSGSGGGKGQKSEKKAEEGQEPRKCGYQAEGLHFLPYGLGISVKVPV